MLYYTNGTILGTTVITKQLVNKLGFNQDNTVYLFTITIIITHDYVPMTSSSKKGGTGIGFPGAGALFLYHVNEVGAGLHQEWVDIPENAGRIGRL